MKRFNKPFKVFLLNLDNPFLFKFKKIDIDKQIYDSAGFFILTKRKLSDELVENKSKIDSKEIVGVITHPYWEGNKLFANLLPKNLYWGHKIKKMLRNKQGIFRIQGTTKYMNYTKYNKELKIIEDAELVRINNFYIDLVN